MTSNKSYMSTNFLGKARLFFPRISREYQGGKNSCRAACLNQQVDTAFGLQSSCPVPWGQHAGGLFDIFAAATVLHWTVLGCGVLLLSKAGLPHYSHFAAALNSIDYRLMRLSDGELRCVEWNFGKWKVRYMCTCTAHAVVKSLGHLSDIHTEEHTAHVQYLHVDLELVM